MRWHRRLGAAAALLVLILAITGPILVHADALGLHRTWIANPLVLRLYHAEPKAPPRSLETPAGWIVSAGEILFLNGKPAVRGAGPLLGAAQQDTLLAVAAGAEVILLQDGQLVERLGSASLPGPIRRAGPTADGLLAIETAPGSAFAPTPDYLAWRPANPATVRWQSPSGSLPPEVAAAIAESGEIERISAHRLVSDLHSGRIVGWWGPYVMDGAAVVLLLLTVSGLVNWSRRRRR